MLSASKQIQGAISYAYIAAKGGITRRISRRIYKVGCIPLFGNPFFMMPFGSGVQSTEDITTHSHRGSTTVNGLSTTPA
jgi:hypothetical protein